MQTTARRLFKSSRSRDLPTNPRLLKSTTEFDLYNKTYTYKIPIVKRRHSPRRRDHRIARAQDSRVTRSTTTQPPPLPRPPRAALTTSQQQILRGPNTSANMRLVRHELRRHADTHLVPTTKEGREHHAATLQSILDAQSDVLDKLNAMTKVHVDRSKECMEIMYDLYTDALLFSHRGKNPCSFIAPAISLVLHGLQGSRRNYPSPVFQVTARTHQNSLPMLSILRCAT